MTTIKVTPEQLMSVSKQFELAQQTVTQMNSNLVQQISSMGQLWEGLTKEHFYYSFQTSQKNMADFVSLTDSIAKELRHHADKFRLADLMEAGNIDASCLPPPPNSCAVPAPDTRNAFQKSADSLLELGQDFMNAAEERYEKRYDSLGGFLDYWTFGIPKGLYQGYAERASKQFDSANDFFNFWTFGVHGTIREAIFPTNAWSKEHWANMIGTAGLFGGVSSVIKPKISLKSSFKYKGAVDLRQISSEGLRNELPLTDVQKTEIIQYTKSLNFPEDNIIISKAGYYDDWNTGMMYDRFIINTDVLPAEHTGVGTLSANSRVSSKATIAHEIVGHYEAYKAGKAFELYDVTPDTFKRNFALDEAQASIRAARFAPDLTSIERMTLLRDAITRLKSADLRIRDVKGELYIEER